MNFKRVETSWVIVVAGFLPAMVIPPKIQAHCDTMDGPVVRAGQIALERGDVRPALAWVQPADEAEIRNAFASARRVREFGPEAKGLAELYFFETLVRVHRAGEGAPYTGLKRGGQDAGPAVPAADKAIAENSVQPLVKMLNDTVTSGIQKRFDRVMQTRSYREDDVGAARSYVKAYVEFIHYVEAVGAVGTERTDEGQEARGKGADRHNKARE